MKPFSLIAVVLLMMLAGRLAGDSAMTLPARPKVQPVDRYWLAAENEVYKTVPELFAQSQGELIKGIVLDKMMHGDPAKKQIAITFDDGPHPKYTPKLLAILKQYDVKATFFVVGRQAEQHPDLIKAEVAAGNEIGNHTYNHLNLTKLPLQVAAVEIQACGDVIKAITHKRPKIFRPPGGDYNTQIGRIANDLNYKIILWMDDPGDYANPAKKVLLNRTLGHVGNGGIILIHDGVQETIDLLPTILQTLKDRGYQFVTIDQFTKGKH